MWRDGDAGDLDLICATGLRRARKASNCTSRRWPWDPTPPEACKHATLTPSASARHFLRKASMLTTLGPALAPGSGALGAASLAGVLPAPGGRSAPFSDVRRGPRDFFSARPPSGGALALDASPPRAPARGASPRGAASCCAPSLSA